MLYVAYEKRFNRHTRSLQRKGGKSTIWLWDAANKTHRQLTTEGFEYVSFGSVSPDGRSVLYESYRTGTGDLWRLDLASGNRVQLTSTVPPKSGLPRVSTFALLARIRVCMSSPGHGRQMAHRF